MNEQTLEKMKQIKCFGMYHSFKTALESNQLDGFTTDEFVAYLINNEFDDRQTRKINRYITSARFRYKANLEDVVYDDERKLDKNKVMRLAECAFIKACVNLSFLHNNYL
jgi:DNA replication protein DnaC